MRSVQIDASIHHARQVSPPVLSVPCLASTALAGLSCAMLDRTHPASCLPSLGTVLLSAPVAAYRSIGTMKALTPAGLTRTGGSLRFSRLAVPTFRPQPRGSSDRSLYPSPQRRWLFQASPYMSRRATRPRRNRFVILRTVGSPPVALHLASLRRSYLRLLGCDQPRHGLAPCRQSVLADALMAGEGPAIHDFAARNKKSRGCRHSSG
jgi:hypothetical protein